MAEALILRVGVTCCRSSDRNFLLAKLSRNLIVGEVRLGFARCGNSLEDDPLGKYDFMKDLVEGRSVMDFGWRWRGSTDIEGNRSL